MYSVAVAHVLFVRRWQSGEDVGNYFSSRGMRTSRILVQVIAGYIAASRNMQIFCGRFRHCGDRMRTYCFKMMITNWRQLTALFTNE